MNTYRNRTTSANSVNSPFFDIIKKYWFVIIGIIILLPILLKYVLDKISDSKTEEERREAERRWAETKDFTTQQQYADDITPRKDVQKAAQDLAHHLGTRYMNDGWWDFLTTPRAWSENDEEVERILKYQRKNIVLIERLYNSVYTKARSLRDDVNKYLDKPNLQSLITYYKQKGTPWQ